MITQKKRLWMERLKKTTNDVVLKTPQRYFFIQERNRRIQKPEFLWCFFLWPFTAIASALLCLPNDHSLQPAFLKSIKSDFFLLCLDTAFHEHWVEVGQWAQKRVGKVGRVRWTPQLQESDRNCAELSDRKVQKLVLFGVTCKLKLVQCVNASL